MNFATMVNQVDILAIGVHPDDVELSASGTLLAHIELGYSVGLLDLSIGELGTRGTAEIRKVEAENAMKLMGANFRECLYMEDGFFQNNQANLLKIIQVIRAAKPKIILANALDDRHPDHGRAAKLTYDACFLAGLGKIETKNSDGAIQKPYRPDQLLHYIQDKNLTPDFVFDITKFMDKKLELIMAFKSQFYDPDSTEPITPISGESFIDFIKSKNMSMGRSIQVNYAEGFNVSRIVGFKNLFDIL
jgi:N-acetylglucosamine malate deacetylase 1